MRIWLVLVILVILFILAFGSCMLNESFAGRKPIKRKLKRNVQNKNLGGNVTMTYQDGDLADDIKLQLDKVRDKRPGVQGVGKSGQAVNGTLCLTIHKAKDKLPFQTCYLNKSKCPIPKPYQHQVGSCVYTK